MAQTIIPFCSDADFQAASLGVDLSLLSQAERLQLRRTASLQVERYCRTRFRFVHRVDEQHPWPTDDWGAPASWHELFPDLRPLRTVHRFTIEVGVNSADGSAVFAEVPASPVPLSTKSRLPSHTRGQIWWDREVGVLQPVYILLRFGLFEALPTAALRPPRAVLDYSAGYDMGSPPETPVTVTPLPGGGALSPGTHRWAVCNVTFDGPSTIGPPTLDRTVSDSEGSAALADIPLGPEDTVARLVGRTMAGTDFPYYQVARIGDNTTTTFLDTVADADLGPELPGDGYSLPLPFELTEATRLAAARLAGEYNLNARGMRGLDQLRTGPLLARRHGPGEARLKDPLVEIFQDLLEEHRVYTIQYTG